MAVSTGLSSLLSSCLVVGLFSGMQMYKTQLVSSQLMTILGGFLGSVLFILILTAVGNVENILFGKGFQSKLFPEVTASLIIAMVASGMVHRVCITTCFLFSLLALYNINKISTNYHAPPVATTNIKTKKSK